jgi:hypothetical protein
MYSFIIVFIAIKNKQEKLRLRKTLLIHACRFSEILGCVELMKATLLNFLLALYKFLIHKKVKRFRCETS